MTFRRLALNNVIGNRHQYAAFVLSSVFSVMIFYLYASFIYHPDVVFGRIQGGSAVRTGLIGCEFIIAVFSFFFVLYSCSAFLKSRQKEFGLLLLGGFTKGQLRRMVLYENMTIGAASTAAGIGLGILFSKLFFMALSELLGVDNPLRFLVPLRALVLTAVGYVLLFLTITALSMRQAGKREIAELLQAARQPKSPPRWSPWLVLLTVLCLGAGYGLAYNMQPQMLLFTMLPIIGLVVAGTYFLFTQASVAVLRGLQARKPLRYRGTNLIVLSQLTHKIKDNARTLFLVSVLSAVILTASGTLYVFHSGNKEQIEQNYAQSIGYVELDATRHQVADPEQVRSILAEHGLKIAYELRLTGVPAKTELPRQPGRETTVLLVSEADYNVQAERMKGIDPVDVAPGHAYYIYPYRGLAERFVQPGDEVVVGAEGVHERLSLDGQRDGMIAMPYGPSTYLLVLDETQYAGLAGRVPDERKTAVYGFELKDWESKAAREAVRQIAALIPADRMDQFESRIEVYAEFKQFSSLTLFIALFVSVLFFMASGSLLFFKLFTEMAEDRAQIRALTRIGLTAGERSRIVTWQIGILFFIPCVVGAVHGAFAMRALENLLRVNVWGYAGTVLLIYLAMQTMYFLAARNTYLRLMRQDAA